MLIWWILAGVAFLYLLYRAIHGRWIAIWFLVLMFPCLIISDHVPQPYKFIVLGIPFCLLAGLGIYYGIRRLKSDVLAGAVISILCFALLLVWVWVAWKVLTR